MNPMTVNLLIALAIIIVIAFIAWIVVTKRRTEKLQQRFGPEYARQKNALGSTRKAEAELAAREERVERYHLRPLTNEDRTRFIAEWKNVQARFVESPGTAIAEADRLLGDVMAARGYPVADFDQCAADLSVDHPVVVENYRAGHAIALRHTSGQASTEDLRQAMLNYRRLFEELTGTREVATVAPVRKAS